MINEITTYRGNMPKAIPLFVTAILAAIYA